MNRLHLTTKIAFVLDIIIISIGLVWLIAHATIIVSRAYSFVTPSAAFNVGLYLGQDTVYNQIIPVLGAIGLTLSIAGFIKQRNGLSILLIVANGIFMFWGVIFIAIYKLTYYAGVIDLLNRYGHIIVGIIIIAAILIIIWKKRAAKQEAGATEKSAKKRRLFRIIIPVIVAVCAVAILSGINYINQKDKNTIIDYQPLSSLQASEIKSIEVGMKLGNKRSDSSHVDDPDHINAFIAAAHALKTSRDSPKSNHDLDPGSYFIITLNSGEIIDLQIGTRSVRINGEWYVTEYEYEKALDQIVHNVFQTGSADIFWEPGEQPFADLDASTISLIKIGNGSVYKNTLEQSDDIKEFVDAMREITIIERSERKSTIGDANNMHGIYLDYTIEIHFYERYQIVLRVKNPYIQMYHYTYMINTYAANALDNEVRKYFGEPFRSDSQE